MSLLAGFQLSWRQRSDGARANWVPLSSLKSHTVEFLPFETTNKRSVGFVITLEACLCFKIPMERFVLTDAESAKMTLHYLGKLIDPRRSEGKNRLCFEAVLRVVRTASPCLDLPGRLRQAT